MKLSKSSNSHIIIRSAAVTLFLFICAFMALYFMGRAFSAMEMTINERKTSAFYIVDWDIFSVFGKEYNIPLMTYTQKIYSSLYDYAPGIIKILGFVVNGTEEITNNIYIWLNNIIS